MDHSKPKAFVIGSVSNEQIIRRVADEYRLKGYDVDHVRKQPDKTLPELIKEAFDKIYSVDLVVVATKPDGSVGTGTLYEASFANWIKKPVVFAE